MKSHLTMLTATVVLCITILFVSQNNSRAAFGSGLSQPPIGKDCVIQFRRGDALGGASNLPVSPITGSINGAQTSMAGKLRNVTEEWIVIESNASTYWIPKASILLIQLGNQ